MSTWRDVLPADPDLHTAVHLALAAGSLAADLQGSVDEETKTDATPVSEADRQADEIIVTGLRASCPTDGILSEERDDDPGRLACERVWIVDPIDGTRAYLDGRDEWGVQIALSKGGTLVLGVVAEAARRRCLVGMPGRGLWVIDAHGAASQLSPSRAVTDTLVLSRRRAERFQRQATAPFDAFTVLPCSCVGIKVDLIIGGAADGYVHPVAMNEWDAAAPLAIALAAGLQATDLRGEALRFNTAAATCPSIWVSRRPDHATLAAAWWQTPLASCW